MFKQSPFRNLLIILISLCNVFTLNAQKLYWVGGSGNFNDPVHWSFSSGGKGGAKRPTQYDHIVFDSKSFRTHSTVTITGNPECRSFEIGNIPSEIFFDGSANESITIYENFSISSSANWDFLGRLQFKGTSDSRIYVGITKLKSSLVFEKSNAKMLELWRSLGQL